jgi:hypothetical protein
MTRDDLTALIARVEAATRPNFTLEVDIAEAIGRPRLRPATPAYTASLDAAASLYPTLPDTIPSCPRKATAAALRARLAQMGDDA